MIALQFFFVIAGFSLISRSSSEGVVSPAVLPVTQRKHLLYPPYYKPFYNLYQQTYYPQCTSSYYPQYTSSYYPQHTSSYYPQHTSSYYPQHTSSYYPQYNNGFHGGYQQQGLGQQTGTSSAPGGYQKPAFEAQISSGTPLGGGYQPQVMGTQISSETSSGGGYQPQSLGTELSSGTSLGGFLPNVNFDLVASLKPKVNVLETISDVSGNYVYGKKK